MDCSAVVAACNEYPKSLFTVQSIVEELSNNFTFEVIVVDNLSTDSGPEFFKSNRHPNVRYFEYKDSRSHWQAKNLGIEKSRGRNLFFIDAHCLMGKDSLGRMITFLDENQGQVGGVHMLHRTMLMQKSFEHRAKRKFIFDWRTAQKDKTVPYEVFCMSTCGMMTPKKVFDELGGWNKNLDGNWGGESYINFKHGTCGFPHFIDPATHYVHYRQAHKYKFSYYEGHRNQMIAAYVNGGDEWLERYLSNFCSDKHRKKAPGILKRHAEEVAVSCKDDREFVASRQKETLSAYFERWRI